MDISLRVYPVAKKMDFVMCPVCRKGRLCDKSPNTKVHFQNRQKDSPDTSESGIILKCPKCGDLVLLSIE